MPTRKNVTFSLDQETIATLRRTAAQLGKAQSLVVREAITEYSARSDRLTEAERRELLERFDALVPKIPERPAADVDRELSEIRESRRGGGRRSPVGDST